MKQFGIVALLIVLSSRVSAQGIVDEKSPLELISAEFGLADGPAWDGQLALFIPDVKGQKLFRYVPQTGAMTLESDSIGRISASYFNQGELYLSDNAEGRISKFTKGMKIALTEPEGEGRDLARPNDLVVDNEGGIYYTLTGQSRVMYRSPVGDLTVAVAEINTPNGLTLSPNGRLFMVGEHDNPARNEPSRTKLKEVGVWTGLKVYKDGKHGCWNQLPWFNEMVQDMDAFFQERLAK